MAKKIRLTESSFFRMIMEDISSKVHLEKKQKQSWGGDVIYEYFLYYGENLIGGIRVCETKYPYMIRDDEDWKFGMLFDDCKFPLFEIDCFGIVKTERGKGYGNYIMKEIINTFGKYTLQLRVGSDGDMSQNDLIKMYEKFGFIHGKNTSYGCPMIRLPNN